MLNWLSVRAFLKGIPVSAWLALALFAAVMFQTARIEGFKIWPFHIAGLKAELADARQRLADTQAAFDQTVANYRAAAEQARRADAANVARVKAEQAKINQETSDAYQSRLAATRAQLERLRSQVPQARADSGSGGGPAVPAVPTPTCGADAPTLDPVTRAFDCAIQLDELIKWANRQAGIEVNGATQAPSTP
jgi:hypothetical protein